MVMSAVGAFRSISVVIERLALIVVYVSTTLGFRVYRI